MDVTTLIRGSMHAFKRVVEQFKRRVRVSVAVSRDNSMAPIRAICELVGRGQQKRAGRLLEGGLRTKAQCKGWLRLSRCSGESIDGRMPAQGSQTGHGKSGVAAMYWNRTSRARHIAVCICDFQSAKLLRAKKKNATGIITRCVSAEKRTRTSTPLRGLEPESVFKNVIC
jgi:hypothetical protein